MVDLFHVWSFRIKFGLLLQTLENRFELGMDDEGNLELVLPAVESHEAMLFEHAYPHRFIVCTIVVMLVPGCLAVKSM